MDVEAVTSRALRVVPSCARILGGEGDFKTHAYDFTT